MKPQKLLSVFVVSAVLSAQIQAQDPALVVERPRALPFFRSYMQTKVPTVQLSNSDRLHSLIRAGKMYLTLQDAIALAIENNLDLEVDRYGPLAAQWRLERLQAGGALPGVTGGNTLVNQASNGQGVLGSQVAAGLASNNNNGTGGGGNAIIAQIGPVTPNLDAAFQNTSLYSHITTPQPNTTQSQTSALVDTHHVFNSFMQQGLLSGGYVQVAFNESYLKENAPTNVLNPSVAPVAQVFVRHNLLNGFGVAVNSRFIRVANKNVTAAEETFRSQLLNLVASVANQYWDLVTANEDLKSRLRTLEIGQKFYRDTKRQIELEALARVEIYRAEADLTTRKQEVAISTAAIRQQENLLKNAISRNGLEDSLIDQAEIVPLDHIEVPEHDDLPPFRKLVESALAKRPDIALARMTEETSEISLLGTANGVLPQLQGTVATYNSGLSGVSGTSVATDPYYVGGVGNALGQIFRRNFPSQRAGIQFFGNSANRIHQSDHAIDQLQFRQTQLITYRTMNQLVVDISNQVVALRQARSRYAVAVESRVLQQQLLEKEQKSFSLGGSTIDSVIAAERSVAISQTAEVAALSFYSHARVSLDQVTGETLERNNISVEEALAGRASLPKKP